MKTTSFRRFAAFAMLHVSWIAAAGVRPAGAEILINEVHVNPPGGDGNIEFIEFISTTGGVEALDGLVLLAIDSAGPAVGGIVEAYNLADNIGAAATGTNGLLIIGNNYPSDPIGGPWTGVLDPATAVGDPTGDDPFSGMGNSDLGNDGLTLLLVTGFTGAVDTDIDTDDDGVFDEMPWTSIVDSVGWRSGLGVGMGFEDRTYAPADLSIEGFTPDSVARFAGDFRANTAAAWYGGDILGDEGTGRDYDPAERFGVPVGARVSPGLANAAVAEPSTTALAVLGALVLVARIRRRRRCCRQAASETPRHAMT